MSTSSTVEGRPLTDLSHTVLLAGAGKMGGALLQGWLTLGLLPEKVAVIEPQPSPELAALSKQGLRLNPSRDAVGAVAAVVVAVKPQIAPEVVPALVPFVGAATVVVSIMAGRTLAFLAGPACRAPRSFARCRTRRPQSAAASRWRSPTHASCRSSGRSSTCCCPQFGAVEWDHGRIAHGRGNRAIGLGTAYVFLLAESMARGGTAAGLPPGAGR